MHQELTGKRCMCIEPFAIGVGDMWGFCGGSVGAVFKITHYACTWQHFNCNFPRLGDTWGFCGGSVEVLCWTCVGTVLVTCRFCGGVCGFGFGFLRRSGAGGAAPFHSIIVYDSLASRERIFDIRIVDQPETGSMIRYLMSISRMT